MTNPDALLAEIHAIADDTGEQIMLLDSLEGAIVGYGTVIPETETRVIYSLPKIIEILTERDGMTQDDVVEFVAFNILSLQGQGNQPIIMEQ